MILPAYSLAPTPQLHFGKNKISMLPELIASFGSRILLVTGASSFVKSAAYEELVAQLSANNIRFMECHIQNEPSPDVVDNAVTRAASDKPDVVVGIGGGSALDAAKAISAMLLLNEPVKNYLEGVGTGIAHPGKKVPFIAIPTTSGTGSETTRNAVLSEVGDHGFKRSLRHNNFVSNITILDPQLMLGCPPSVTAYSGMDAFTQLLESYLSTGANPMTDLLALEGLRNIASSLLQAFHNGANVDARSGMAFAAYLSGITLTNAGLGLVHGLAGVIGGHKNIPHGIICSTLMPAANKLTVRRLREKASWHLALTKYATVGKIFTRSSGKTNDYYVDALLDSITSLRTELKIPTLGTFGTTRNELAKFAAQGENKNNPMALSEAEILEVLELS